MVQIKSHLIAELSGLVKNLQVVIETPLCWTGASSGYLQRSAADIRLLATVTRIFKNTQRAHQHFRGSMSVKK